MTQYVDGTFIVPAPLELKEFLKSIGYKEFFIDFLFYNVQPIQPMPEPSSLKFYQNFNYSKCKNEKKIT